MAESASVAITTVLSFLVIADIVGNCLVCLIIKKNRDMRIPMNYLLVNLAVADILYAVFVTPRVFFKLAFTHPDGVTGTVLCKLLTDGNVALVGGASSVVTLVVIAIERYYAVMYPRSDKGRLTKRKLKVIISGSWIFSLILNVPVFLAKNVKKKSSMCVLVWPEWMRKAYILSWVVLVFISCGLMVGLYSNVVYTLWFKRNNDNQLTYQQQGVMRVRKRVTLMVVTVSIIFGICWGMTIVIYVLKGATSYNIGSVSVAVSDTMVLFNSAVNPFVYALLNKQFRERVKKMMYCTSSLAPRVHPTREPSNIELADDITHSTHAAELSSREGRVHFILVSAANNLRDNYKP